jgi:glycyl-tRNA synthetase
VAIFPLVKKDGMPELAIEIHQAFRRVGVPSFYDDSGSIGRRYRRQDEAGTPYAITVDGQSLQDRTVTIRDRDSLVQQRVGIDHLVGWVRERIA